jgi:pimeloyl-[acyl-carrier protein] methyl ester esterase
VKQKVLIVTGWSYGPESLRHLAQALQETCDVQQFNHAMLTAKAGTATLFPCSNYARGLITVLDQMPEPCWLIGWSMGGMIALETAIQMPRLVKGLVAVSSTVKFVSDELYASGVPMMELQSIMRHLKKDHRTTLRRFYTNAAKPHSPDVSFIPEWTDGMQNGLTYLEKTDLRKAVTQIAVPTLILHGQDDAIVPFGAGQFLNKAIPGSKLISYYGVGHDLPIRKAKVIAQEITTFMQANTPPA